MKQNERKAKSDCDTAYALPMWLSQVTNIKNREPRVAAANMWYLCVPVHWKRPLGGRAFSHIHNMHVLHTIRQWSTCCAQTHSAYVLKVMTMTARATFIVLFEWTRSTPKRCLRILLTVTCNCLPQQRIRWNWYICYEYLCRWLSQHRQM